MHTSVMPLQLARGGLHSSMPLLHNQMQHEVVQADVQASSAFAGTFGASVADRRMAEPSPVMRLDFLNHGLGSLDLPDVCMENLDTLDFDPADCLF